MRTTLIHELPFQQPTFHRCPNIRLALHDGVERAYRLDDPGSCPYSGTANSPASAYEPRVHLAYLLARQGHRPDWLARFADLPPAAAHRLALAAAQHRAATASAAASVAAPAA
ncbi:hypothetical protein ABTZ03_14515 [Kitasatospora sp. NPDC096077]|uniref:hypothetical protein n=1 Tax=Kitasatospora sp. NPDC096077 TaxID=3155544 RepID=UPI00331EB1E3